jgi:hypothetical protein
MLNNKNRGKPCGMVRILRAYEARTLCFGFQIPELLRFRAFVVGFHPHEIGPFLAANKTLWLCLQGLVRMRYPFWCTLGQGYGCLADVGGTKTYMTKRR